MSAGRVVGKVVVVTGAAGGQGAATASGLARDGASVIAVDLAEHPVADLGGAVYLPMDVTDAGAWTQLADRLARQHGAVDGLVNNAGVTCRARLLDLDVADLRRVMQVNVEGALLGIQHLAPLMPPGSSIVNVGSVAALTAHFPVAYTASKWALRGLSKAAALELGPARIRVNLVHPGYIETPMTASAAPEFRSANVAETPLGRTGTVDDVAPLMLYLISDESAFVTGAEISVDGGLASHGGVKSISDALRDRPQGTVP